MRTCHIVGAGDFFPERFRPLPGDFVIAADAGYSRLVQLGAVPDMVIGDFDSLGAPPEHPDVTVCPVVKDDTDTLIALRRALELGYGRIFIHGGTGGRLDHTLANIQCLLFAAERGAEAFLLGGDVTVTAISGEALRFEGYSGGFSAFCMGGSARGVFERGSKYTLTEAVLTSSMPLGVSNEFAGLLTEVSVREGALVVTWQGNLDRPVPERRRL